MASDSPPPSGLVEFQPTMPNYVYNPLNSAEAEIRLLAVEFNAKHVLRRINAPLLVGSLKKYYLPIPTLSRTQRMIRSARLPTFFALSYVWGDPTRTHDIIIDDKRLRITENLYTALRELQPSSLGFIWIWADAICINQDDLAERSAQVLLMREIYHSAADVKIWLGPSNENWMRCLRFISNLTEGSFISDVDSLPNAPTVDNNVEEMIMKAVMIPSGALARGVIGFGQSIIEVLDILDPPGLDEKAEMVQEEDGELSLHQEMIRKFVKWKPPTRYLKRVENESFVEVADLIDRVFIRNCTWFERMWVVQELGVADDATFIASGGRSVSWSNLIRCVCYLHYTLHAPVKSIRNVIGMEKIRQGWNGRKRQPLRDLIRECRYRRATDPRDKIFSLLGLMGDKLNAYLKPDYSKSVREVYANVALHFIAQSESLDPLCSWQTFGRQNELPSWVPDYSLDQDLAPCPLVAIDGGSSIYNSSGHNHRYKYSRMDVAVTHESWSHLRTVGLCIDLVAVLSDPLQNSEPFGHTERLWNSTIRAAEGYLGGLTNDVKACLEGISSAVEKYSEYWTSLGDSSKYLDATDHLSKYTRSPDRGSKESIVTDGKTLYLESIEPNLSPHDNYIVDAYAQTLLCGRKSARERISKEDIRIFMNLGEATNSKRAEILTTASNAFEAGMRKRSIAVTRNGYIGAVPHNTQSGDFICVLFGCSVPVVVRKRGQEYLFIGESYLHGFMDAEALVLEMKGELNEQDFVLT